MGLSSAGLIQICSLQLYIKTCAALLRVPGKMAREDCDCEHRHPWGRRRRLFSSKQAPAQQERVWVGIDVWGCTALVCAQRWSSSAGLQQQRSFLEEGGGCERVLSTRVETGEPGRTP